MSTAIRIIILILIPIIIFSLFALHKKNKDKNKKSEEETQQLTNTITATEQHLKYKKRIALQTYINGSAILLIIISLILVICLPIFRIKIDILGETLVIKQFSLIDNANTLLKESNESAHFYTDIDGKFLNQANYVLIAFASLGMLYEIVFSFILNGEKNAKNFFVEAKQEKRNISISKITDIIFDLIVIAYPLIIFLICKNAENKIESNKHFTVTQIDNYLYYYLDNGEFMCKVFLNDFKYCNGVSGYIAVPIIFFTIGLILFIVGQYLKHKLVNEISKEEIEILEEPATAENTNDKAQ